MILASLLPAGSSPLKQPGEGSDAPADKQPDAPFDAPADKHSGEGSDAPPTL